MEQSESQGNRGPCRKTANKAFRAGEHTDFVVVNNGRGNSQAPHGSQGAAGDSVPQFEEEREPVLLMQT